MTSTRFSYVAIPAERSRLFTGLSGTPDSVRTENCVGLKAAATFAHLMKLQLVAVLLVVAPLPSLAARGNVSPGQAPSCDPLLEQPATNPYGYRLRGDRCEGIFVQQVAGTTLLIASFTESFDKYDVRITRHLDIRWTAPAESPIQLRAYGLRRKLYYRMDTTQSSATGSYTWPTEVLAALNVGQPELGVVGWTRYRVGRVDRDVYLPLQIGPHRARSETYTLVLLPGVPLSEVYVSMAAVGVDGRPTSFIRNEEPLKYNYYPAERPVDIPISRPSAPGIYYLLIGATMQSGGSVTAELWIYHPPR